MLTKFSAKAETRFSGSNVAGRLRFLGAEFPGKNGPGYVLFQDLVVEGDGEVAFEGVDLSRASFLRSNLGRVRFRDVRWATIEERIWYIVFFNRIPFLSRIWRIPLLRGRRQVLFDHQELNLTPEKRVLKGLTPHLVGEVYRQLRLNLEPSRQEIEAGDFYIGQMDLRRKDEGFPWPYRHILLGVYRFAALYGESWQRPLVLYLLLGFAFAFVYLLAGFEGIEGKRIDYTWAWGILSGWDYAQALAHALSAGGILQQAMRPLSSWAPLARLGNALLDAFLLGLALIALRRRFRR